MHIVDLIAIDEIAIGERHRKDLGDLEALADSIERIGLQQAIGLTPQKELVYGERRLQAFKLLGRTHIPARLVDVNSIVEIEHDENEMRKAFTPSERVAIGQALEKLMPERRGNVAHVPHLKGEKTRDIAAKKAGFSSTGQYRNTKKVVEQGSPELVEAMDTGIASIRAAADLAELPKEEQVEIVAGGQEEIVTAAKELREDKKRQKSENVHVSNNSGEVEWYTPENIIEAAREVMVSIDLDPATSINANDVVKSTAIYTKEDNGLEREWHGNVWLNPPYGQPHMSHFAEKAASEIEKGNVKQAIILVNNATETRWFQRLAGVATSMCFHKGRIRYWYPSRDSHAPLQGQAIIYFGPSPERFAEVFNSLGFIVDVQWTSQNYTSLTKAA